MTQGHTTMTQGHTTMTDTTLKTDWADLVELVIDPLLDSPNTTEEQADYLAELVARMYRSIDRESMTEDARGLSLAALAGYYLLGTESVTSDWAVIAITLRGRERANGYDPLAAYRWLTKTD